MLRHAGQALLEADRARLLAPWGPMAPEARRELEIALERARKSLEERQKFG